ncbi:MAG: BolA family transcriptional regulator [Gammaproteobacteria bacterium RIFCSPHIGHO2_12_FULL_41_20]|nr:MAG: BolA family transcriptional regulator [Gammaproteobacteria bacterium RIFCSPHIGHO2_12_FULL_41_20]
MQIEVVKQLIKAGLQDANVIVEGDGAHFMAIVVSPQFASKSRIQRQQLVYNVIRKQLDDGSLHAISLKTYTPQEWQAQGGEQWTN